VSRWQIPSQRGWEKNKARTGLLKAEFAFSIKTDLAGNQIGFDFPQRNVLSQTKKGKFIFALHWVFVISCRDALVRLPTNYSLKAD